MNTPITGVIHVGFYPADLDRALHFYCDLLGMKIQRQLLAPQELPENAPLYPLRGKPFITYVEAQNGVILEFFSPLPGREAPVDNQNRIGISHIAVGCADVPALVAQLRAEGVQIDSEPRPDGGAAWVRDPDGNRVEIMGA